MIVGAFTPDTVITSIIGYIYETRTAPQFQYLVSLI